MQNKITRLTNAKTDPEIIHLWLSGKSKTTRQTYSTSTSQFLSFVGKPLNAIMLEDVVMWTESFSLRGYSDNTIRNKLAAIRSLFSFGVKVGYLRINPVAIVKPPKPRDAMVERIISQTQIKQLISAADKLRDRLILKVLYTLGLRVSELTKISWRDIREIGNRVLISIHGKGSKTRVLLLPHPLWGELQQLPRGEKTNAVFLSRFGNRLDRHAVHRLVKKTAIKAGINDKVSAHWIRHGHACHSLRNGAGIELVMKSLGHSSLAITSKYLHCEESECTSSYINLD